MKKVLGITLAVALLLGMLTGCSGRKPANITMPPAEINGNGVFTMSAAQLDANGVVWRTGKITLEITKKGSEIGRSGMKITTYECAVSFHGIGAPFTTHLLTCSHFDIDTAWLFAGVGYVPADNLMKGIVLYMDEGQKNCLIRVDGNPRYFVASVDPDFDPIKLDETLTKALSERLTYG